MLTTSVADIGSRVHFPASSMVEWFFVRFDPRYGVLLADLDFRSKFFPQDLASGKLERTMNLSMVFTLNFF